MVDPGGIGWLHGDYVATPTWLAWLDNLWCRGRLRYHRDCGRTVNRSLITEQGYSSARWPVVGVCWCTRLDRELVTDRTRIATCDCGTSVATRGRMRRRFGGRTRWEKRECDDPYDECSSGN
ncbi:MAG: hypothetical protein ABR615_04820 [Pseudonocardiaceae bacterium]